MKYECKENDVIIELKNEEELYIYIDGDKGKIVIGINDLIKAINAFSIDTGHYSFTKFWNKSADLLSSKNIKTEYREGVVDCRIIARLLNDK